MSTHSIYAWMKKLSKPGPSSAGDEQAAEIRRLKNELVRVGEERGILNWGRISD